MANVFIIVALLVGFFLFIQKYLIRNDDSKDYTYKKSGPLLNAAESTFFNALRAAVGEHGIVLAKVSMTHAVMPKPLKNKKQWFIAHSRIAKHYFSFVVCDARTLEPRVIMELDDGKPLNKGKIERQKLLLQVCQSANIPLIGANIKYSYQVGKLRRLLAAHIDLIEPDKEVRFVSVVVAQWSSRQPAKVSLKADDFSLVVVYLIVPILRIITLFLKLMKLNRYPK
ncbi:Zn-finger domain associated with topoisomerase type I [Vibrio metschnikovii]|nr:Zn-finger domain associated with topoisomerase type I [Vibrio metschnikovii]